MKKRDKKNIELDGNVTSHSKTKIAMGAIC